MNVLIVRHASAGDRRAFARTGRSDSLRPLTAKGRAKMRRAAGGIKRVFGKADLIASSPLARAKQTMDILLSCLGRMPSLQLKELSPDSKPDELLSWLRLRREQSIVVVGHEPQLGKLIAFLCTGRTEPFTELRKGQACLLEFSGTPDRCAAKLLWSLKPSQLRKLDN